MRVLIVIFALFGAALAAPKNGQRIVGGTPTTIETYPYMSNMQYNLWNIWWMQWCGGTLITPLSVLSAAHCFYGDTPSQWRVALGSTMANGGTNHQVGGLVLHPNYNDTNLNNDVAIVRLATLAVYGPTIQGATLTGTNVQMPDGTLVYAIGWGALYSNGPSADNLQHVDMNVINQQLCVDRYAYLKTQPGFENWPDVNDGMICTGILDVGGKDACQGDSGGPVAFGLYRNVVCGIVSWGYGCGHPFYPGVLARVSYYLPWIQSVAN